LNKSAGVNAIAGNLVIGDGTGTDTVRLLGVLNLPETMKPLPLLPIAPAAPALLAVCSLAQVR